MTTITTTSSSLHKPSKGTKVVLMNTVGEEGWSYLPVRYALSDLPGILPPTSDLLPSERKILRTQQGQKENEKATLAAYDKAEQLRRQGGFTNKVKASMGPRWTSFQTKPSKVHEPIPTKSDEKKFNKKFHFSRTEPLLYVSDTCKVLTGNLQILGTIYIGENFLCFKESKLQPRVGERTPLHLVIPINSIVVLAKGTPTTDTAPGLIPEYRILDNNNAEAEALFLYTNDGFIHRFWKFWTKETYQDTFTVLDRQWRVLTGKPIDSNSLSDALQGIKHDKNVVATAKPPLLPSNVPYTQQQPQPSLRATQGATAASYG